MTIRFEQVSFRYPGGNGGVQDIDFALNEGELLAMIGPSGSGKSTCLRLLAGLHTQDSGRISVAGEDLGRQKPEQRALGIVFQSYALFPHMSVGANVAYPLKVRRVPAAERRRAAEEMLERVGLGGMARRSPATLSGGQQQRVALARALVFQPRALLLDEPLSALDAGLRVAMRDEIRRVQRDAGIATLHVTHDQEEALSIADRVAVLRDGRIEQIGPPAEIYDRPVNRFVASFVGQANFLDGLLREGAVLETAIGPLRLADTQGFAVGDRVTALIRPERIEPLSSIAPDLPNCLPGQVIADRFLGPLRRFDFQVGGGVVLVETRDRGRPEAVAIPPEVIRLLPPESSSSNKGVTMS